MNHKRHNGLKPVKQRLSQIHLVIKKDLKPLKPDVDLFAAISAEMVHLCQNEWRTAMDEYMDWLEKFESAM